MKNKVKKMQLNESKKRKETMKMRIGKRKKECGI